MAQERSNPEKTRLRRELQPSDLIRAGELCERLSIGRSTLWRRVRSGHLPRPFKIGPRCTVWSWGDIADWLASRRSDAK